MEECSPAFEGVEAVFAEAEGSCSGGGPGVDHAHLDEVEFFVGAGEPTAGVVDVELEVGDGAEVAEVAEDGVAGVEVDEDGIEFDAGDVGDAEVMGGHDVASAADSDDGGFMDVGKTIGQADEVVLQERDGLWSAIVVEHVGARGAVDVQAGLGDGSCGGASGRVPRERVCLAAGGWRRFESRSSTFRRRYGRGLDDVLDENGADSDL